MKKYFQEAADMLGSVPPLALTLLSLSVVCMNLLANKSIDTGLDWLALDCGILFSGVAFLAMDVMTHCYGPRAATVGSLTALVINLLKIAGGLCAALPGIGHSVSAVAGIAAFVFIVMGIYRAANYRTDPLPLIGELHLM